MIYSDIILTNSFHKKPVRIVSEICLNFVETFVRIFPKKYQKTVRKLSEC
jgi:hypothetical protein